MTVYPALTLWQPWASLVATGAKPLEFRGWPAPERYVGERIAIHAGARPVRRAEVDDLLFVLRGCDAWATGLDVALATELLLRVKANPFCLPLASVLCTAVLGIARTAEEIARAGGHAMVADSARPDHHLWGWPLTDILPLQPPQPARGAQGFWRVRLDDAELTLA